MTNFKLSEHFNLIEYEHSSTAIANHIDNTFPPQFIPALQQLAHTHLHPQVPLISLTLTNLGGEGFLFASPCMLG